MSDSAPTEPGARSSRWLFKARSSALDLAVFRISVATIVLLSPQAWRPATWSRLAPALRVAPEGLGWFVAHVPINATLARVMGAVLLVAAALALVGLWTRRSLAVVCLSGFYVFALPQLSGSVTHDMHLLWFAALLAVSPSGDALSVDSWRAGRLRAIPEGASYAWPLDVACLLFGAIYFFPGWWKLRQSGLDWIFSDNLRNQLYWKWFQAGAQPGLRPDRWPWLCQMAAAGVVVFELSFPLLVLHRRWRPLAAIGGLAFHLLSEAFFKVGFLGLWGLYPALIEWRRVARWAGWTFDDVPSVARPTGLSRGLGVILIAAVVVQGARGAVQAWPFGCYPTFASLVGSEMPDVMIEELGAHGERRELLLGPRRPEGWALTWRVVGAYGDRPAPEALRAYWGMARRDPAVASLQWRPVRLRFHRVARSVIPEESARPPRRTAFIGELSVGPQP